MKKWRCTVCNYIHTGEEPPETCPVCGADKSKFVEISEEEARSYESRQKEKPKAAAAGKQQENVQAEAEKTTKASEGKEREQTKTAGQGEKAGGSRERPEPSGFVEYLNKFMVKHHLHPMSVHVPNGVLPVVVIFMFLAAVFASESLARAAFYFAVFTLLFMPVVLYTGINVWQRKYRGAMTSRFIMKLVAAGVVTVSLLLVVVWFLFNPDVILAGAARRGGFLVLNLIMLGAASVAGWIGGKLVFKD